MKKTFKKYKKRIIFNIFFFILVFIVFEFSKFNLDFSKKIILKTPIHYIFNCNSVSIKQLPIFFSVIFAFFIYLLELVYALIFHPKDKKFIISLVVLVLIFGFTIYLCNMILIELKLSLIYFYISYFLLENKFYLHINYIKFLFSDIFSLSNTVWEFLNMFWVVFFIILGFSNIYISIFFPVEFWLKFKVFGFISIIFGFLLLQIILIYFLKIFKFIKT